MGVEPNGALGHHRRLFFLDALTPLKLLSIAAAALTLAFAPAAVLACSADVELVNSQYGGSDVLNTFRLTQGSNGPVTVTFGATTAYQRHGKTYTQTSSYSTPLSAHSQEVTKAEKTAKDVDEIVSVKISNIRCVP